jgi:hypothetical protein
MEEFIPEDRRKFLKQMTVATLAAGATSLESEHFETLLQRTLAGFSLTKFDGTVVTV